MLFNALMIQAQAHLAFTVTVACLAYELAARVTISLVLAAQASSAATAIMAVQRLTIIVGFASRDALHGFLANVALAAA